MRSQSNDEPKAEAQPEQPQPEAKPAAAHSPSLEERVAALEAQMHRVRALTGG